MINENKTITNTTNNANMAIFNPLLRELSKTPEKHMLQAQLMDMGCPFRVAEIAG